MIFHFLGMTCEMLGLINSIDYSQFKQNIKYKRYRQWDIRFLRGKPPHQLWR